MSDAIHKKKIRHRIVGHEKVHATIVVYVRGDHAPSFSKMRGNAGFFAHVGERAVSIIMEEPAGSRLEDARNAVVMRAVGVHAAGNGFVELGELANKEVQAPVVVVIEPHRARTPAGSGDSGLFGNVSEG